MLVNLPAVGFKAEVGVGPHPTLDCQAVNVWLTPSTDANAEKLRRIGKTAIQGALPVDRKTARLIERDPLDPRAEHVIALAMRKPLRLAKTVAAG